MKIQNKNTNAYWVAIGGSMHDGESIEDTAFREILEETGLQPSLIQLGPVVWFGEFDLMINRVKTRIKQRYIVAHTSNSKVTLDQLTNEEKSIVKDLKWFSLAEVRSCKETIYPKILLESLPPILQGDYPNEPMRLDLS